MNPSTATATLDASIDTDTGGAMPNRPSVRALTSTLAATTIAGILSVAAPSASATTALTGSVMYDKNSNVFVTDGATTRQVTTDGSTPAADGTGSTGYLVPTESDDGGIVVAVRNQQLTSNDQQHYLRGYLWVMDGYGHVIRKINPPQFPYQGTTTCGLPTNNPRGIVNAQVSPDGQHIAYTFSELFETFGCSAASSYGTTIVDIDGTNPVRVDDGAGDDADLEIGSWAGNSTLLTDRGDFGSVEDYTVTLPGASSTAWVGPDSFIDAAYAQPDVRGGKLVTIGYSEASEKHVTRLWSTSGYTSAPTYRCEVASTVNASDVLGDPSLAPDGSAVAYQDTNGDGSISINGQGIYTMSTANNSCGTPTLLVAGANDAFWSPAAIDPPVDTVKPSVTITAPTAVAIAASSVANNWQGSDAGSGIAYYQSQYEVASASGGFSQWADFGQRWDPAATVETTVSGLAAGDTYCLRVEAVDNAGNIGYSASRCFAVALDDRKMSTSSHWSRVTGNSYYDKTATVSSTRGAALSRSGGTVDRVGVVAKTCRGCGTVGVYVGTKLIGKLNLAADATHYRVIKMLPRFGQRSGTVRVKVLTSGKPVTVDGVVTSRA
ncbi:MAG TPA: hypothetical protein VE442_08030 [Jatrophihabitans sp.]|nr:hypothetical protein [Jatrophihabitans sp.]